MCVAPSSISQPNVAHAVVCLKELLVNSFLCILTCNDMFFFLPMYFIMFKIVLYDYEMDLFIRDKDTSNLYYI